MLSKPLQKKRKGSVLVEYALLIAGIVLVSVVAIAVLGHKMSDQFAVIAAVLPGAHTEDNKPIASGNLIPFDGSGDKITLNASALVSKDGVDRMESILGPGGTGKGGELLVVE